MGRNNKRHLLTAAQQAWGIKCMFPDGKVTTSHPDLIWEGELSPTPISPKYKVRVHHKYGFRPEIYVLTPLKRDKKGKLPHVYSIYQQKLCLFYGRDWYGSMHLASTVIPWASEWLYFYEIWLSTGKWKGGGNHNHDQEEYEEHKVCELQSPALRC